MTKKGEERRKDKRHSTEIKIYFDFAYDLETKVRFEFVDRKGKKILPKKYPAVSRNISVEGLCFVSRKKVKPGDLLHLEVYLPTAKDPIHMKGEVKWYRPLFPSSDIESKGKKGQHSFLSGVKLLLVNGESVQESIHYDREYDVNWSIVMESVLGSYRMLMGEKYKNRSR